MVGNPLNELLVGHWGHVPGRCAYDYEVLVYSSPGVGGRREGTEELFDEAEAFALRASERARRVAPAACPDWMQSVIEKPCIGLR